MTQHEDAPWALSEPAHVKLEVTPEEAQPEVPHTGSEASPQAVFLVPQPVPVPPEDAHPRDEAEEGGRFLHNDKLVNAERQRIHEDGRLLDADELKAEQEEDERRAERQAEEKRAEAEKNQQGRDAHDKPTDAQGRRIHEDGTLLTQDELQAEA